MSGTVVQVASSEQRLRVLNELSLRAGEALTASDVCRRGLDTLGVLPDLPFALIYTAGRPDQHLHLDAAIGLSNGPATVARADPDAVARVAPPELWGLDDSTIGQRDIVRLDLDARHDALLSLANLDPRPTSVCVMPMRGPGHEPPVGYLVAGLHPTQRFNTGASVFLHLAAHGLGCALEALKARDAERTRALRCEEIELATSTFFHYISHELRTPLHAILGWAQVLGHDGVDTPQLARGLEAIERNARAQSLMVDALMALRRDMSSQGFDATTVLASVARDVASAATVAPSHEPAVLASELSGVTVLVVDDNVDAREVVAEGLGLAGAMVITAASSEEGLALLARRHPDLIVSDLGLPGVDGHMFMRQVRALDASAGGTTPAVALSAFALRSDRERALRSGYQMHLSKPAERSELVTVCASLTGRLP